MSSARPNAISLRSLEGVLSMGRVHLAKRDLAADLFAFAGTMASAAIFRWQAGDVIWALWISSLCVGYATIVTTILRGVSSVDENGFRAFAVVGALAALAFFSVHFGMFHFVHAMFLNTMFPLAEGSGGASGLAARLSSQGIGMPNPVLFVAVTLSRYWPLVVASFISRFSDIAQRGESAGDANIAKAYGNVVRMHLLIFVFAGLHAFGLSRLAIIPVLAAYFFPWKAVAAQLRR